MFDQRTMTTAAIGAGVYYAGPMMGLTDQQAMMAAAAAAGYYMMYM